MGLYTKKIKMKKDYTLEELSNLLSSDWNLGDKPQMNITKGTLGAEYIVIPVDALYCLHVTIKRSNVVVKLVNTTVGYGAIIASESSSGGPLGLAQDAIGLGSVADANTKGTGKLKAVTQEIERILESN